MPVGLLVDGLALAEQAMRIERRAASLAEEANVGQASAGINRLKGVDARAIR